jgi:hypothetical protein
MNKEIYKLVGAVGATMTGMYAATMTAVSRQQEINANKEIALKKLELDKVLTEDRLALDKEILVFDRERFEFEKLRVSQSDNDLNINSIPSSNDNLFDVNSALEPSNLVVENLSLTFICFTSVTIILTISLTFNYLIKMYGNTLVHKLPRIFHPIYKFYNKYLLYSSLFDLSIILLCQSVGLLLCLFLYLS